MGRACITAQNAGRSAQICSEFNPGTRDDEDRIVRAAQASISREIQLHHDRYTGYTLPRAATLNLQYREPGCWRFFCNDSIRRTFQQGTGFYAQVQSLLNSSPTPGERPGTSLPSDIFTRTTPLTQEEVNGLRGSHPALFRLLNSLLQATTFVDLRTPEERQPTDAGAPPRQVVGLFEALMAQEDPTHPGPTHPNRNDYNFLVSYLSTRDQSSSDVANNPVVRFVAGDPNPLNIVYAEPRDLLALEQLLDRVPPRPDTQAERVWTIEDPSLHTWLTVPASVTPRPAAAREHSRFAVAFHNFRILLNLVQQSTGRMRVRDIIFRFRTPVCNAVKNDNERSERRRHFDTLLYCNNNNGLALVESNWSRFENSASPQANPNERTPDIQVNQGELDAMVQFVSLFALEPPSALFSRVDGQQRINLRPWPVARAREYVATMIYVRNAIVEDFLRATGRRHN